MKSSELYVSPLLTPSLQNVLDKEDRIKEFQKRQDSLLGKQGSGILPMFTYQ